MKKTVVMNYNTIVSIMYATQNLNKLNNVFYSNTVGDNDSMFTEINDTIFYLFESYISEALSVSETVKENDSYLNEVIKLFDNISFHLVNGNSDGNIVEVITYFNSFLSVCKKNCWINKEIQIVFPSNDLLFTTNA